MQEVFSFKQEPFSCGKMKNGKRLQISYLGEMER